MFLYVNALVFCKSYYLWQLLKAIFDPNFLNIYQHLIFYLVDNCYNFYKKIEFIIWEIKVKISKIFLYLN